MDELGECNFRGCFFDRSGYSGVDEEVTRVRVFFGKVGLGWDRFCSFVIFGF